LLVKPTFTLSWVKYCLHTIGLGLDILTYHRHTDIHEGWVIEIKKYAGARREYFLFLLYVFN